MSAEQFNIDYHQLLGVNRNADEKTIRRAFRQLSLTCHPDKVAGQDDRFKLLNMAKMTLIDPDKRAKYDANYEFGDNQPDLTADLLRLTIGHRLSDNYRAEMEQWKKEYPNIHIIDNMNVFDQFLQQFEQSMLDNRTVFDLDIYHLIHQNRSDQMMLKELRAIFIVQDFDILAQYILTNQCRSVLAQLYEEVNSTRVYESTNKLKALLQIIKVSSTLHVDGHQNRIKGLYEAILIYPVNECMDCVLKLINNRITDAHKNEIINTVKNHNLLEEIAENKLYMSRLNCNPTLRSIFKYEKAIHNQNLEPMEKAMLYIDLCMVYGHPVVLANNLVMAARELIAHMTESTDTAEVYALKNCLIDLCATALHFVSTYANPISQLKYSIHVIRLIKSANQILGDSIKQRGRRFLLNCNENTKPLIGELDVNLLKFANHCVSKSIVVSPFIDTTLDMSSDVLYINLINNELLEKFYQWNIDTYSDHSLLHLYQYSLMEGSWKCWFDESKFEEYRRKCMKVLLGKTRMTEHDVARTMKWEISCIIPKCGSFDFLKRLIFKTECGDKIESKPMITRCDGGWIVHDKNHLNVGKMSFNSVDGLIIDIKQGTFEIIVSTDEQLGPLCDSQDIDEIVIKGLSHGLFSLDQADFELDYHPFQLMRFAPKSLENSRYLTTLLAADYILKMIATNTEVSAQAPFEIKQAADGFLKALPTDLKEFLMMKKSTSDYGKVHRFWIENGDIPFYNNMDDNGKITYEFYYTSMQIKKHLMKKNSHGELVDDFDDSEDELTDDSEDESDKEINQSKKKISAAARFARRLTQYYDLIGSIFPVLLRLRELAKLSAISTILKNIYIKLEESKTEVTVPRNDVNRMLDDIRSQITYPICTESKVDELYWKCLRDNGLYNDSSVSWQESERVKNKIRSALNKAENELFIDLPKQLSKSLELKNTSALGQCVSDWIRNDECNALIDYLCSAIYEKKVEELSKFGNNLKKLGVNLDADGDTELGEGNLGCKWVPASFSQLDGGRVYGGVFLRPKVNLQNNRGFQGFQASTKNAAPSAPPGGGSSYPPSGGSGSSGGDSGSKPPSKPLKTKREEIMETYGNGKGWPTAPIRAGETYFGIPGTSHKTNQGIIVNFGPSGWAKVHNPRHSTRKAAIEAAARANRGYNNRKVIVDDAHAKTRMNRGTASEEQKKDDLNKNRKGDHSKHVHSTYQKGNKTEKLNDGVHHLF